MSGLIFHKSVYTTRSTGYKYRTLATNTDGKAIDVVTQTLKLGEKKHRDEKEDSVYDKKFRELTDVITDKIDNHFKETQRTREMIVEKLSQIDAKVDTMLEFQDTVKSLKKELATAECTLANLYDRVEKLDCFTDENDSSTSTLLYLHGFGDTRDVLQQNGDLAQVLTGDYYINNRVI